MKKKSILLGAAVAAAFCVLAVGLWSLWQSSRPETEAGEKNVTVAVVHSDGERTEFHYSTEQEYLGELLKAEGLIEGEEGEFGLFVKTVDGEAVDFNRDQSWWKLTCNGKDAETGADSVVLRDGDVYEWIYTTG